MAATSSIEIEEHDPEALGLAGDVLARFAASTGPLAIVDLETAKPLPEAKAEMPAKAVKEAKAEKPAKADKPAKTEKPAKADKKTEKTAPTAKDKSAKADKSAPVEA